MRKCESRLRPKQKASALGRELPKPGARKADLERDMGPLDRLGWRDLFNGWGSPMSLSDLASLGSFVSGLAVLLSLVFFYFQLRQLGIQVRQAERNQQGAIRQGRISRAVELQLARTDPGIAAQAWRLGVQSPDEITQAELDQFLCLARAQFLHFEDGYYQHEEGLLNDDAFEQVRIGSYRLARFPGIRTAWKSNIRGFYGGTFQSFVDDVVARAAHEPTAHMHSVEEWRDAFAAETASGSR